MTIIFIVVANQVLQCLGARYCDSVDPVLFTRMWEAGVVEVMFELPGVMKVYRRVKDKFAGLREDRSDKKVKYDASGR
jgi:hypothetical protein